MSGDDDKGRPSNGPDSRRAALARKLGGGSVRPPPAASRSSPSSAPPSAPSSAPPPSPSRRPPTSSIPPVSGAPFGHGERRPMENAVEAEIARAMREPPVPGPGARVRWSGEGSKRPHPLLLGAGALLLLLAAVLGATRLMATMAERSPSGRVRAALLAYEFGGESRDAAFVELDGMGAAALAPVVDLMSDASPAERGSSRSTYTMRQIAQTYLLRVAARLNVPPPPAADETVRALRAGSHPSDAQWASAQSAWRGWIAEQQSRGALRK